MIYLSRNMYNEKILTKEEFPKLLNSIDNPPERLFIRGELPSTPYITIVGSRAYTEYGKKVVAKIIKDLSKYDITIVSGLAIGIDGIAHKEAIQNGLKTIAVLPSGLKDENIYPRTHKSLAMDILQSGGCLLSENENDSKVFNYSFHKRNRIMAGISEGILIVECERKSGTSITAKLSLMYNREVFAIPHSIFSTTGEGPLSLIEEGAHLIRSGDEITEILGISKRSISSTKERVNKIELEVLSMIEEGISKDDLLEKSNLSQSDINQALSSLEIRGFVKEEMGLIKKV